MALAHRRPTIQFPRLHDAEFGASWRLHWNGQRAANGDGKPGADGAAIDYANAIAGPYELWTTGKLGYGLGGYGLGDYGCGGAHVQPAMGYGEAGYGVGGYGVPGGWASWQFPYDLRDGSYLVGVVLLDARGNVAGVAAELAIEVAAVPRPPRAIRLDSYDGPNNVLVVSFDSSPDLE